MTQEFVTLPREVVEQALEALFEADSVREDYQNVKMRRDSITALRAALDRLQAEQDPTPSGATHIQLQQGAFYKRVDGKWYVWSLMKNGEPRRWYISPGTDESRLEPLATTPKQKREPLTIEQPQAEQPAMTPIAQRKLDSLLAEGYTISGYSVYHERKHQHGFVTGAGLVGWWKPEGVEYPQPQVEQEPVGEAGSMPGTDGFTMACFRASDVPVGTKLYTRPHHRQPLNDDEILHTGIPEQLWFAKRFGSAPAGWTDEQIRTHNFFQSAVTQLVRAIERAHGIK